MPDLNPAFSNPPPTNAPPEIHFTTLGMFIIDQIHFPHKVVDDIIGGAGTYAILGARLFSPSPMLSRTIGWIVDAGSDFPPSLLAPLQALQTTLVLRHDSTRLTTRGWNAYGPGEHRAFRYLTPKKRLEATDLVETGLERAKGVHLICSPKRARGLAKELCGTAGLMIWEPVPDLCTPEHREEMFLTLPEVDVVSPNAEELSGFFGDMEIPGETGGWVQAEFLARRLLEGGVKSAVVVRMGARGCLVATRKGMIRLPAVYGPDPGEDPEQGSAGAKVVDPTGGGNTFIGGMGVGLVRGKGPVYAAAMGSVAASFAIEQMGLPTIERGQNGEETWNGVQVEERMREYLERLKRLGVEYED